MLERIENLIHLQDFLHIERKNQIEIEENKRTHNLSIKDSDYYKKQERQKSDIDLELWYNVCVKLCWIKAQIYGLGGGRNRLLVDLVYNIFLLYNNTKKKTILRNIE